LLNRIRYAPVFAESPSEAIQLGKKHALSVLVLDGEMPDQEK